MSEVESADVPPRSQRTIVALGGHEFSWVPGNSAIGDYLLGLTGSDRPRVCLLPTASGDPVDQITSFRRFFGSRGAEATHLSLFRLEGQALSVREHLLSQDMIYAGGGSMLNLIAIIRAHRIDEILEEAWRRGILLCGQSAGAMLWFEAGITRSRGSASLAPGLGFLEGTLSVHYHRDPDRRSALSAAIATEGGRGYGIDDQAAMRFEGAHVAEAVAGREGAAAWGVEIGTEGSVIERRLAVRSLPPASPLPGDDEIDELRATLAAREPGLTARFRG